MGFLGLLTVLFIGLKLTNYLDWNWWWVLSPAILWLIGGFIVHFLAILEQHRRWKILILLPLSLSTPAFAEDGLYFYGNVGQSRFSQAGGDGNWRQDALGVRKRTEDFSWDVGLGYKINPYLSFEAGYLDFGAMQSGGGVVPDQDYDPERHSYNHHVKLDQFDAQGAAQAGRGVVKLNYPIGNFSPFVIGGVWGGPQQVTWRNASLPDRERSFNGILIGGSIGGGICYQWVCGQVEYYRAFVQTGFPLSTEFIRPSLQVNIPLSFFIP